MSTESRVLQRYREWISWQTGVLLAKLSDRLTATFPNEEKLELVSQKRRTAVSIPSNLAEDPARDTSGEWVQFISPGEGSTAELDTQLTLSIERGFCAAIEATEAIGLTQELRKTPNARRRSVSGSYLITFNS